ncbi:DNA annealing helicase and endonuclease ZRANB3, partial [Ananas comosus]
IRRLKGQVLSQLPPKRRQIIRLKLKAADIHIATASCRVTRGTVTDTNKKNDNSVNCFPHEHSDGGSERGEQDDNFDDGCKKTPRKLSPQEVGIAKLSGFGEWFSNHCPIRETDDDTSSDVGSGFQKTIIFAHHLKVLDGIQAFVSENGVKFVRIDGSTLPKERKEAVDAFHFSAEVKIAIIGITAGGCGLDLSSARNVVFLELPKTASEMVQAEDRAHRRGQTNAVNIYIFCAKGTYDESHWLKLNESLFRVSSVMNGKQDAIREIEVDRVLQLENSGNPDPESTCMVPTVKQESLGSQGEISEELVNTAAECVGDDADFIIHTVPLKFEDDKFHAMDIQEDASSHENQDCDDFETSQSEQSGISSCKAKRGDRKLDLSGNGHSEVSRKDSVDNGAHGGGKAVVNSSIQVEFLRFEVSQHTRRIHLYLCIPGEDSRPRPLFKNFRPEELEEVICSSGDREKETTSLFLKENPAFSSALKAFTKEWNSLRPIDQNKLHGKPLQLPLGLELLYLKDSINHNCGGLLKGGSKRRVTPLSDISHPLPENAEWKKVTLQSGTSKEKEFSQAWTVNNEPLCKLCQGPCNGKLAKSPEYFEDLFCNLSCFQEYRIRTSQRALRQALFQIECGICTQCKLDCCKLVKCIRPLSIQKRKEYIAKVAPKLASRKRLLDKIVHEPTEGNAWHADHMIPVYKGGGECKLENMRTLCVACHYEVTKAQRDERRLIRVRAKELLKSTMKELKDGSKERDSGKEELADDPLLVMVPGSAYSREETEVSDKCDTRVLPMDE